MPSYKLAAQRHHRDASLLLANGCLPSADHLYGFAAECALKAVMLGLGMSMDPIRGRPEKPHSVHVNALWPLFHAFVNGQGGVAYSSVVPIENPFQDWSVHDRYEDGSSSQPIVVDAHQAGADLAVACMNQAILDGVVP